MTNPNMPSLNNQNQDEYEWISDEHRAELDTYSELARERNHREFTVDEKILYLDYKTSVMSVVQSMKELPEFQEVVQEGVSVLPKIFVSVEKFDHWRLAAATEISDAIDNPIVYPEDMPRRFGAARDVAFKWWAQQNPETQD